MQKQIDEIDLKLYNLLIHRTELVERQPVNAVENTLGKEAAAIKNLLKFIAAIFLVTSLPKSGAKY